MSAETIAFQAAVQRYIVSQDNMTAIRKQSKELNELIKKDSETILSYMGNAQVNKCTAGHYTLMVDTKKKLPQVNAAFVLEKAKDVLQLTEEQTEFVIQKVKEARQEEGTSERCLRRRRARSAGAPEPSASTASVSSGSAVPPAESQTISHMVDELYD